MNRLFGQIFLLTAVLISWTATVSAQGLLWSLPEDGTVVKYVGKYKHKQERPDNNAGALELEWDSELIIQSVGQEDAEFAGTMQPCRWIEIKLVTGKPSAKGVEAGATIDAGPNGTRIYKVLIPESRVTGQLRDSQGLPVTFIPIVKGVRKIGKRDVEPIGQKVLASFPTLGLFANYADMASEGDESELDLPGIGSVKSQMMKGTLKLQNSTSKSENVGEIWLSADVPFGWAKYHVKLTRESKDITAPETDFAPAAEIEVEMVAVEKNTGAKSELGDVSAIADTAPAVTEEAPAETPAAEDKPAESTETEEKSTESNE